MNGRHPRCERQPAHASFQIRDCLLEARRASGSRCDCNQIFPTLPLLVGQRSWKDESVERRAAGFQIPFVAHMNGACSESHGRNPSSREDRPLPKSSHINFPCFPARSPFWWMFPHREKARDQRRVRGTEDDPLTALEICTASRHLRGIAMTRCERGIYALTPTDEGI